MSEKELEAELARLKDELKEWKAKYEDAVKQRKEIESKLGAASDEKPPEDEGEKVPIPPRPAGRPVPSETPTSPPATPSTTSATSTPASTEGDPTPRRVPIKPPAPGLGGVKIPVLDRSKKDLKEIDKEDILAKTYLKKLYMFQNHITSIPSDIGNLTELQVLDMKYNRVQTIPDAFCSLAALTELLLTGNAITSLPKDLSKLSLLAKLDLAENRIASFPKEILTLPALTDLNLERNKLRELPQEIDQLAALTKLNLSENKLTALPPQIGHLANLGELLINSNRLSTVPADIGHLIYLHNLQLANNSITSLPDDICYLTALTKLGLKNNALSSLPETVAVDEEKGWYSLTNLNLAKNKFTHIPPALWTNEAIEELNFTSNKLKELPPEINHLYSLRSLLLGNNEIPSVPVEISHLEALENLHLFFNRIEHLPDEIAHLYNLRVLFLGYNKLKSVPDLSGLAALEQLFLGGNPELGKGLHESVWGLNTLHHLFLQNTGIEAIPPAVSALTSLSIFDVSANKLKAIPPELSKCEMLSRINASHNQLSTLPDDLDDLRELIELDISSNKFEALPPVYGYVKERVEFLLDNNPFKEPLDEASHPHQWVSSARFHYDAAEMLGRRPTMEDAFSLRGTFMGKENMDYFGLYDGHAGRIAATFCGEHVHKLLAAKIAAGAKDPSAAIAECFREVNIKFKEFLETADSSHRHAGTTGVAILIVDNKVHLANVGDTRVVLNRGGKAIRLSFDHKPNSDEEEARIRALGGFVIGETSRVNGLLAVSRSIGDFYMHPFVSDESYLNNAELTGEDRAIIIACDGLWDEVTDEEAVALLEGETDPFLMSAKLRDMSYLLGSDDNISVNVILLKKK